MSIDLFIVATITDYYYYKNMINIPSRKSSDSVPSGKKKDISHLFIMRSRLVIVFTLLYITAFTMVSFVSYSVSKAFIIKDINVEVQEVLNAYASEVDQWLKRMVSVINANVYLIEKGIPDDTMITPDLLSNYSRDAFFSDMYFGSTSGRFISGTRWNPPPGYDPRTRPWYNAALSGDGAVISMPYLDMETGTLAVPVSSSVHNKDGSLRGVISGDLLLTTISAKLENVRVRGKGFAAVIDSRGVALVHPNRSLLGKNLTEDPEIGDAMKQILILKQGRIEYGISEEKYVVFTTIPTSGWYMGIVLRREEMLASLKQLSFRFNQIFAVSLVLVIAASLFFAKRLTLFTEILENEVEIRTAELREKIAEVEYLSLTDPLTGIANRRKIQAVLDEEIIRSDRTAQPLSVISMDLDHFKKINDTYGHEAGDTVLKLVSDAVSTGIRGVDHAGRMGGEEFIIVCPDTPECGVINLAEKLRAVVENLEIPGAGKITASFGCALRLPDESIDRLLSRADSALYRAKELGETGWRKRKCNPLSYLPKES
jgi:diguanylate cyclase (GGDEF)-like protein